MAPAWLGGGGESQGGALWSGIEPAPAERGADGRPNADDRRANWLLLLTAEREAFGSRRSRRAASYCEVLEQILAQHPPEASGRPEEDAPAG
ncbi:hypothetical protein ACWCPX_42565 [Streptomyces olivaceoviridis]